MRLLFVTQKIDADHPVLAQTVDVVRELAARFDAVDVLCDAVGRHDLPANVRLRTFGSRTRVGRGVRFVRALAASVLPRETRPSAVLIHMVPLFALLAAPLVKPLRIPMLLWYTHWNPSRPLRLALPLLDVVMSVSRGSFPIATSKLEATGHAIDVAHFAPAAGHRSDGPLQLLALGRTARWKGYDTMLDALELGVRRGCDARLEIRGPQLTDDELPALLAGADALLSATQPRGSETLDKVVYEAAACEVPVLASNDALKEFLAELPLQLTFPPRDAEALADRLVALGSAAPETRAETGAELRRRVVAGHSVSAWADTVTAIVARLAPE